MPKPRPPQPVQPNDLFDDDSDEGDIPRIEADDDDEDATAATATEALPTTLPFDARLVVEKGDYAGEVLKLGGGIALIGRSSKCELSLKGSPGVSRRHCKVQLVADRYVVIDLESRNGTVVNGETVSRKFLTDGDLLEIGDEHVRFIARAKSAPVGEPELEDQPTGLGVSPIAMGAMGHSAAPANPPSVLPQERAQTARHPAPPPPASRDDDDDDPAIVLDLTASFVSEPPLLAHAATSPPRPLPWPVAPQDPPPPVQPYEDRPKAAPRRSASLGTRVVLVVASLTAVAFLVAAWDLSIGKGRLIGLAKRRAPNVAAALTGMRVQLREMVDSLKNDDPALANPAQVPNDQPALAPPAVPPLDAPTAERPPLGTPPLPDGALLGEPAADAPRPVVPPAPPVERPPVAQEVPPSPPAQPAPPAPAKEIVVVKAVTGGRVAEIRVKAGSNVKRGQVIAVLEASGALRRKLESLREEERAFEQAVRKGNDAARRDLEVVREGIAELVRRVRGPSLVSPADGVVVEVLVSNGNVIKTGQAVLLLR